MKELIARLREDYCSCIDGYKSRGMTDPQCSSCDSKDWREECADALERMGAEVNRQKSCILTMAEEIQTLVREKADMQEKIRTYHQHGVTCQTFGHVVGACSECNTHVEQDVNETNHVLASNYLKLLPEFERLTAERDALRADAERLNWMEDALKCYFFQIQSQPSGAYVVQGYGKKLRAAIDAAIAGEKT